MSKSEQNRTKPTLKTIAEISGLAVTTVSRALGDAPDISESTKVRIRKIANEIGYIPNRAGVRLRTGRTQVISLVLPVEDHMSSHSLRLTNSVARVLRDTNYHLNVTHWFEDEDQMLPIRRIVENGLADGIILNVTQAEDERVAYLRERNFPFATHGRTNWASEHAYFDFDNQEFVRLAISQLAARGRKKIGLILPPPVQFFSTHMVEGARMGADENAVEIVIFEDFNADSSTDLVETRLTAQLKKEGDFDAILASSAWACMATVNVVDRMGLKLGQDFDVYSREAIEFLHLFRPEILLVYEDVAAAGTFVANALLNAIRNPDEPPMQKLQVPTNADLNIAIRDYHDHSN